MEKMIVKVIEKLFSKELNPTQRVGVMFISVSLATLWWMWGIPFLLEILGLPIPELKYRIFGGTCSGILLSASYQLGGLVEEMQKFFAGGLADEVKTTRSEKIVFGFFVAVLASFLFLCIEVFKAI